MKISINKFRNKYVIIFFAAVVVIAAGLIIFFKQTSNAPTAPPVKQSKKSEKPKPSSPPAPVPVVTPTPAAFNKQQNSIDDPASIWVVVNKPRALNPLGYTPGDLVLPNVTLSAPGANNMQVRQATANALVGLFDGARNAGNPLMVASAYRSYSYQTSVYNGYVNSIGQTETDKVSARPGHSEHQTGLSLDVEPTSGQCNLDVCFGDLPAGKWVAANAYQYGFIVRYPADKTAITGYSYEPWHIRYVGVELATEMHNQNVSTLEEFFGVAGGPNY